jgi:hypothetical protein
MRDEQSGYKVNNAKWVLILAVKQGCGRHSARECL